MKIVHDPIKTSSFFSLNSKSKAATPVYTHFENYVEFPEKGRLFGVLNLSSVKDFDCFKNAQVLKSLIVSSYYNGKEKSLIDAIENTIAEIKSELSQMISLRRQELEGGLDLNCLLVTVRDNVCYIGNFGDNEIFLVRDGKEFNLNIHLRDTLGRNQVRVASILMNEGDIIYIATPNTVNKIIDSKLRNCIENFDFEKLDHTPLKNDPSGLGIFAIGYKLKLVNSYIPKVEEIPPQKIEKPKPTLYPIKQEKIINENINREGMKNYEHREDRTFFQDEFSNRNIKKAEGITFMEKEKLHESHTKSNNSSSSNVRDDLYNKQFSSFGNQDNNNRSDTVAINKKKNYNENIYLKDDSNDFNKLSNEFGGDYRNNFVDDSRRNVIRVKKEISSSNRILSENKSLNLKDITFFNLAIKAYHNIFYKLSNFYQTLLSVILKKRNKSFEKKIRAERFEESMKRLNTPLKVKKIKRKINLKIIVPALVCVIILLSLFISNSMKIESEKRNREQIYNSTQSLIDKAKSFISESEKYANLNKKKARELLSQAELNLVKAEENSLVDFNSKIDELRKDSQIIVDKKIEKNIILDDTNVVQDFASIFQSPTISGMEISDGRIYIGLKDGRLLESGQQLSGNLSFINVLQNQNKISIDKISQDSNGNILLYDSKDGLYRYTLSTKVLSKVPNMTSLVVGNASAFLSATINTREYLYYFNPLTKDLMRSLRTGDGYANPEVRIHDDSFDQATSLTIDGRIWVATRGMIKKYYDANEEPVNFNQALYDFPITKIMNIKATNDKLVLSDDASKRVIVFGKVEALTENSLNYIASYILKSKTNPEGFNSIVDFEFGDGFIYILDSKKLYRATYQIPAEYLVGI